MTIDMLLHDGILVLVVLLAAIRLRWIADHEMRHARLEADVYRAGHFMQIAAMMASTAAACAVIRSTVITSKMLAAWKKEREGHDLPE